jgi:hypothetical protein
MSGDPSELARLLDAEAEHAEATRNDPPPAGVVWTRPGLARSVTFSLRLNPEELAALQDYAQAQGVPASTIARGWIVARLAAESYGPDDTATMLDRLETDVRTLRKLVAS